MYITKIGLPVGLEELLALSCGSRDCLEKFAEKFQRAASLPHTPFLLDSGRSALIEALRLFGIGPGDEVLLPAFCCSAVLESVLRTGAVPVLADVSPATFCLDADKLGELITSRTKAIIAVDTYGLPSRISEICEHATRHGIITLWDCAHQLAGWDLSFWSRSKSVPHAVAFSFGFDKALTTGRGGALWIGDDRTARRYSRRYARCLPGPDLREAARVTTGLVYSYLNGKHTQRVRGILTTLEKMGHDWRLNRALESQASLRVGRMGWRQAAVGLVQLRRLPEMQSRRRDNALRMYRGLMQSRIVEHAPDISEHPYPVAPLRFPALIKSSVLRNRLMRFLRARNIGANISAWSKTLAHDPLVSRGAVCRPELLSGAEYLVERFILLPTHPRVCSVDVIVESIRRFEEELS